MSKITRIKAALAAVPATAAPLELLVTAPPLPTDAVQVGFFQDAKDGALAVEASNDTRALVALYDALKAYETRLRAGRAPLVVQKTVLLAALAGMEL